MKTALFSVSFAGFWGQATLSMEDSIRVAADLGYDGVVLMGKRPHLSPLDVSLDDCDRLADLIRSRNLELAAVAAYTNFTGGMDSAEVPFVDMQIAYVEALAHRTQRLGGDLVRIFTSYERDDRPFSQQWRVTVDAIRRCADRAAQHGVTLAVQNHHDLAVSTKGMAELLRQVDRPNVIPAHDCWSPFLRGEDLAAGVAEMAPRMRLTTVADYVTIPRHRYRPDLVHYTTEPVPYTQAVPMGEGDLDYGTFFSALADAGFAGWVSYEMCSPLRDGGSRAALEAYARRFLDYMRPYQQRARQRRPAEALGAATPGAMSHPHRSSAKPTDVRVTGAALYLLPIRTRLPIRFGRQVVREVTCARVRLRVEDAGGRGAEGWAETPLSVQWAWPEQPDGAHGLERMIALCRALAAAWADFAAAGHPMRLGRLFDRDVLPTLVEANDAAMPPGDVPLPYLAAIVCNSAFDLALHDAYANLLGRPVYETYTGELMGDDLAACFGDRHDPSVSFDRRYPADFLVKPPAKLPAWHLIGGADPLTPDDPIDPRPDDGHPVDLLAWVRRDGLQYLKIKLRGDDAAWDYQRVVRVGTLVEGSAVRALSVDFNCTVTNPAYVIDFLDRLKREHPAIWQRVLHIEQPFPRDLERHAIDVREVASRKPLLMDESAHHWELVRFGRALGWNGVALKTCKTQTGALLSLCWAKAHGMALMVQDLANPMLAIIPHAQLAAHAGTLAGVETNATQFYPDASRPEAQVHPGIYRRRDGHLDLSTLRGPGFGYRLDEIERILPDPAVVCGRIDAPAGRAGVLRGSA